MSMTSFSKPTIQSMRAMCSVIKDDASRELEVGIVEIGQEFAKYGMFNNSRRLIDIDVKAGEVIRGTASKVLAVLMQGHDSEPCTDAPTRIAELQELMEKELHAIANALILSVSNPSNGYSPREAPRALELATHDAKARIQITVATAKNRGMMAKSVINIASGSVVGNVMVGSHQSASNAQTVSQPGREEFKAAVENLEAIIRNAPEEIASKTEVLDLLAEARAEADKPNPNKLKISTAISTTGSVVSMIANAPAAVANALAAFDVFKGAFAG
jgi:hypothetical protein